jgi:LPPG:FO 2-phospho-L-lactate transferase
MANFNDTERGWGVVGETWQAMAMLRDLGEAAWFNLGDRDLGMHIGRSWRLREGETLSEVTRKLANALSIDAAVVPMSDAQVRTQIATDDGWLDFQRYFVAEQCRPVARAIRFAGTPGAAPSPGFAAALARTDLAAVVLCPSNPYLSVDPILAVDGVRDSLLALDVPIVAVSPLVGGTSLKGPLGKLLGELGEDEAGEHGGNQAIARHYSGLIDRLIIDTSDAADAERLRAAGLCVTVAQTVMRDAADRERLAREVLFAAGVE